MTLTRFARTCVVALLLCWVSAGSARAADATTVGTWKGPMDTQIGTVDVALVIEGEAPLAGRATMDRYEGKIAGKRDGDKLSFTVTLDHGVVKFEGTVSGDEMKLNVTGTQGDAMNLVAKRQK
jgi:hypothetical protein